MALRCVNTLLCYMIKIKKLKDELQLHLRVVLVFTGIVVAIIIIQEFFN